MVEKGYAKRLLDAIQQVTWHVSFISKLKGISAFDVIIFAAVLRLMADHSPSEAIDKFKQAREILTELGTKGKPEPPDP